MKESDTDKHNWEIFKNGALRFLCCFKGHRKPSAIETVYSRGFDKIYDDLDIRQLLRTINKLEAGVATLIMHNDERADILNETKKVFRKKQTIYESKEEAF